jgi:hypothetical protein
VEVGIAASYNASGTLRWNFDMGQEQSLLFSGIALQDGSSFWAGNTGQFSSAIPMLLGLSDAGQKLLENTCSASGYFWPVAEASNVIYLGLGGLKPPAIVTADASGNIDCTNTLVVKNDSSARITSIWTNGVYLLAAGDFYSKPAGSNYDSATYVTKVNLATKQVLWEQDFQDVIAPKVVAVSENGQDMVYLTAVLLTASTSTPAYTFTNKLDANGVEQPGWPQTYVIPSPGAYGKQAVVPNPLGGVITVGGNCTFTAYKPDGTARWDFQQSFTGADVCDDATIFNGEFLYVAGAVNLTGANFVNEKTLAASFALPQQ